MKAIFITGSDTSVGKTFISSLLLKFSRDKGINAGYQKWVSTGGGEPPADLQYCLDIAGMEYDADLLDISVPYRFRFPASPHLSAALEKRQIDSDLIIKRYNEMSTRYEFLVVEGVGGLLVPLRNDLLLADLLARIQISTIVVARSGLGTLNHTLLTLEALRARNIDILGVVFSDSSEAEDEILVKSNMETIEQIGQVKILGRMRYCLNQDDAVAAFSSIGGSILAAR